MSLKQFRNEVFVNKQKSVIKRNTLNTDSYEFEEVDSNLSAQDDVVMNLDSPKQTNDPKEQHLISNYINKAFNTVTDELTHAALMESKLSKQ